MVRARCVKQVVHAGRPPMAQFGNGDKVIFDYEVRLLPHNPPNADDGADRNYRCVPSSSLPLVEDTRLQWPKGYGKPLELVLGKKFQLPVVEECVKTMMLAEVAQFDIDPVDLIEYPMVSKKLRDIAAGGARSHGHQCAYALAQGLGYEQLDQLVKQPAPLRFTIHLKHIIECGSYEPDSWQLDATEKVCSIDVLSRRGRQHFAAGDWPQAAAAYMEALSRLDTLMLAEKPGEPEHDAFDAAKLRFYLNVAQCQLNMHNYYAAIESATEALNRDAHNEKAFFRRAKAYSKVWNIAAARDDLCTLKSKHPKSAKLADNELAALDELEKKSKPSEEKRSKAMLKALVQNGDQQ